jgi:hypothetical protein
MIILKGSVFDFIGEMQDLSCIIIFYIPVVAMKTRKLKIYINKIDWPDHALFPTPPWTGTMPSGIADRTGEVTDF